MDKAWHKNSTMMLRNGLNDALQEMGWAAAPGRLLTALSKPAHLRGVLFTELWWLRAGVAHAALSLEGAGVDVAGTGNVPGVLMNAFSHLESPP